MKNIGKKWPMKNIGKKWPEKLKRFLILVWKPNYSLNVRFLIHCIRLFQKKLNELFKYNN